MLGRLVSEIGNSGSRYYTYDAAGNRTQAIIDTTTTISYTYNTDGSLAYEISNNGSTSETTTYSYDLNGNLTAKSKGVSTTNYTYNVWGNMTSGAGATYGYNSQNLRTSKTVGNETDSFVLVSGNVWSDGEADYFRGIELISNGTQLYLYNIRGDVIQLTDLSGNVVKTYDYDAYGNELQRDLNDENPFRYCGEYYDTETGFIYLRARYYDPMVGRFTSVDPIKDGLNWYAYCENNPIAYIDPSGKEPISLIIFSLAIFGFVFLAGCSAEPSPPEDFRSDYNAYANCYTYVLSYAFPEGSFTIHKSFLIDPGFFSLLTGDGFSMYSDKNKYYVEEIANFVKSDIDSAGFPMRQIESPDELKEDEYLIALKTSDIILEDVGFADYHFAIQLSDGTWVDKPGNTPPRWNVIRSPYDDWDYGIKDDNGFIKGYYNSGPIFFALKKGGY